MDTKIKLPGNLREIASSVTTGYPLPRRSTADRAREAIAAGARSIDWSSPEAAVPGLLEAVEHVQGVCDGVPVSHEDWPAARGSEVGGRVQIVLGKGLGAWTATILD